MNLILQQFSVSIKSKISQDGLKDIFHAASSDIFLGTAISLSTQIPS